MAFDIETIRRRLRAHEARRQVVPTPRRAAVAAILRPSGPDTEILLIRRAERPGDPWSGHMAFPGGHHEPVDRDLRETAVRETFEEVGLNLHEHEYLGQLDEVAATARGRAVGMTIAPHVFALTDAPLVLRPNHEVAELLWGSLGRMFRGELDAIKEISYGGETLQLPAFQVEQQLVWGMTHGMLRSLFSLLSKGLVEAETAANKNVHACTAFLLREAFRRTLLLPSVIRPKTATIMDEREFERRAAEAWKRVLDLFENFDPDDADVEQAGDVIRIDYRGGSRVVLNTQRPARQLWLAGGAHAWHFSFDADRGAWLDDKGRGELYGILSELTHAAIGQKLQLTQPV